MKEIFGRGWFLQLAIFIVSSFAFLLFGYDQGVFSGILIMDDFLETFNHPNDSQTGIMVSIYNLGCFAGCLLTFAIGDYLGRKRTIWLSMGIVIVGAILQTTAYSIAHMLVARLFTGVGTGLETSVIPVFQAEMSSATTRGRLISTEVLFINLGIVFAYFFDYGLSFVSGPIAWRLPIAFQMVFCFVVIFLVFGLPETPRWLFKQGRHEEAISVMCRLRNLEPDDPIIQNEKNEILKILAIEEEDQVGWKSIFFKTDRVKTRRRVFTAMGGLAFNQLGGINLVVYYITIILKNNVGLSDNLSYIVGGCIQIALATGAAVPSLFLDKMGRRKPLLAGSIMVGTSMMLIAICLSFETKTMSAVSVAFFFTYNLTFGATFNCIPWVYAPEILSLRSRTKGTALAISVHWISNFFIVMITPIITTRIKWKSYLIFMITNYCFFPIIYFFYPETANLTLEQIDKIFLNPGDIESGSGEEAYSGTSSKEKVKDKDKEPSTTVVEPVK